RVLTSVAGVKEETVAMLVKYSHLFDQRLLEQAGPDFAARLWTSSSQSFWQFALSGQEQAQYLFAAAVNIPASVVAAKIQKADVELTIVAEQFPFLLGTEEFWR